MTKLSGVALSGTQSPAALPLPPTPGRSPALLGDKTHIIVGFPEESAGEGQGRAELRLLCSAMGTQSLCPEELYSEDPCREQPGAEWG